MRGEAHASPAGKQFTLIVIGLEGSVQGDAVAVVDQADFSFPIVVAGNMRIVDRNRFNEGLSKIGSNSFVTGQDDTLGIGGGGQIAAPVGEGVAACRDGFHGQRNA